MSLLGEILLDLLEQDRIWRTADGRVIPLERMEPNHRAEVLRMLVRMAPDLYADWFTEDLVHPWPDGFDPYAPEWSPRDHQVARRWLKQKPLVLRLRQLNTPVHRESAG